MRPIVTDRVEWSVCRSVCHSSEPCKNGRTDRDAVWVVGSDRRKESSVRGVQVPMKRGNFKGRKGRPVVQCSDTSVICAKTAETIEMPFGIWTLVGAKKHVLDGVQIPMQKGNF